jgi:threonine/homoserine/homoserine lactone efflux protein
MFIDWANLSIFLVAALTLNLTPGNDMMYVLGQCLKSGRNAGIAASFGIATGSFVHIALVAIGVAAVLARVPVLFEIIRWAGVGYLLWLAYKAFTARPESFEAEGKSRSAFAAWRDGVIVNVLNPKVAIFMLAFLPQFIDPSRGSALAQILFLGLLFNIGGTLVLLIVCAFAGSLGDRLRESPRFANALSIASGGVFLLLAGRLALSRQ